MQFVSLHEKKAIERRLRTNADLHIYSLGDLDNFFWPYTIWYALPGEMDPGAVALLYVGQSLPTLLALSEEADAMRVLLESIDHVLPQRFYAHLSPELESVFADSCDLGAHGEHYKMALRDEAAVAGYECSGVVPLRQDDLDEILAFYRSSYPGNWFDPRMLETNQYFGAREEGKLVSIAGIHVYSPQYRVAALGNIATLPGFRNRGYGKRVTAKVCQSLSKNVDRIGLNIKADNGPAISCYKKLGFQVVASYGEFLIRKK
jgi:ribosomal protein S18 acetylase RimI-like enzyme